MGRFFLLFFVGTATGCGALLDFDPADPQTPDGGGAHDMGMNLVDAHVPVDGGRVDASRPDSGPPPCRLDSQCDDHVFCNGIEVCAMGTCMNGGPPPCTPVGAPDCVVGSCDTALDDCVLRADDSLCAGGEICDRVDGCRLPPTCGVDADCDHDACHHARCSAGTCVVTMDPPCVDPDPTDCQIAFCHTMLGCTTAPSFSHCDDGIPCTTDVCNFDGSCTNAPNDTFCDFDGASCTHDICSPLNRCADPSTGCASMPFDSDCAAWLGTLGLVDPPPECFSSLCMPSTSPTTTSDPATGCAVLPVCTAPGSTCMPSAGTLGDGGMAPVCAPLASAPCSPGVSTCDDGNPCNGMEACVTGMCRGGTPPCGTAAGTFCTQGHSGAFSCSLPLGSACVGGGTSM